jgi:peptidoglycan/xylan/chitin deacetylase (PgdA/CDA1 family)
MKWKEFREILNKTIGIVLFLFPTVAFTQPVPVLMYHSVSDTYSGRVSKDLTVSISEFRSHLEFFKVRGYQTVTFKDILYNREGKLIILTFDDGLSCHYQVMKILESYGMKGVFFIECATIGNRKYLKREQVIEIAKKMEVGSHTINHPWLKKWPETTIRYELTESKKILEGLTGEQVISVAYPYGNYNDLVVDTAIEAGYLFGRTTDEYVNWDGTQSLRIPIVYIHRGHSLPRILK